MAFSYVIMQCLPELNMEHFSSTPRIGTVRDLLFGTKGIIKCIIASYLYIQYSFSHDFSSLLGRATSVTAFAEVVCMYVCLSVCVRPYTVNFK